MCFVVCSMASSEIYENIKEKLKIEIQELKLVIKRNNHNVLYGEDHHKFANTIERKKSQAQILIKDLELEIYQAPMSYRAGMQREIKRFKYDLENITRSWENMQLSYSHTLSGNGMSSNSSSLIQKEQSTLLLGHKSLKRGTESISRSIIIAEENEGIGKDIIGNLDLQKEQLIRTRDRLDDADDGLAQSNNLLHSINKHILFNKIFLVCFIFLELVVLGVVIYLKVKDKKS